MSLIDEAIHRLESGDVSETQFGIRVRVRPDLRDDRLVSVAKAYWPTGDGMGRDFRCAAARRNRAGACSHALAALMFEWRLKDREADV